MRWMLAGNRGVWTGSTVGRARIQLCRGHVGKCWTPSGVYAGEWAAPLAHVAEGPWVRTRERGREERKKRAREGRGERSGEDGGDGREGGHGGREWCRRRIDGAGRRRRAGRVI